MPTLLRHIALLALPSLINAAALSDMTPRARGLSEDCEAVYTAEIPACTGEDFKTHICSTSCINALQAIATPILRECSNPDIQGQNLVVAFLAGVGPQQLCRNIGSDEEEEETTTAAPSPTRRPSPSPSPEPEPEPTTKQSIIKSTTTARSPHQTKSLLVDSMSSSTETERKSSSTTKTTHRRPTPTPHATTVASSAATTSTDVVVSTSTTTSRSKTSTGDRSEETSLEDGSGGGSPFDTPGNMGSAAVALSISALSILLPAAAALLMLR